MLGGWDGNLHDKYKLYNVIFQWSCIQSKKNNNNDIKGITEILSVNEKQSIIPFDIVETDKTSKNIICET